MFYDDMSDAQRAELGMFEEYLHRAGWDIEPIATMLHTGTSVRPEGSADFEGAGGEVGVDFDVGDRRLNLIIEGDNRRLQFQIVLDDAIEPVLEWLVASQNDINPHNFPRFLRILIPVCRMLLFLTPDGKKYHLTLENIDDAVTES